MSRCQRLTPNPPLCFYSNYQSLDSASKRYMESNNNANDILQQVNQRGENNEVHLMELLERQRVSNETVSLPPAITFSWRTHHQHR